MNDLEKIQREQARWFILVALNDASPMELSDKLLASYIGSLGITLGEHEIRKELDYLESRKLVKLRRGDELPCWFADIARYGVDVVQYTVPCEPGIARPPRFS